MYRSDDRFTQDWTAAERSEYLGLRNDVSAEPEGAAVPGLVRETLLALCEEAPNDDDLARALNGRRNRP